MLAGPQHAGRPSETGADQLEVGGGEVAVGQAQSRLAARGEDQDRRGHVDVAGVFINDLALEDSAGPVVRRQEQLRGEGPFAAACTWTAPVSVAGEPCGGVTTTL